MGLPHHITQRGNYRQQIFKDDPGEVATIKRQTIRGRPIASVNFIEKMEKKLKRVLLVKTKGRPKKKDRRETGRK